MKEKMWRILSAAVAALLGLAGWMHSRREPWEKITFWNVLIFLAIAAGFFAIVYFALQRMNRRKLKYVVPLGGFFGVCTACGLDLFRNDTLNFSLGGILDKLFITVSMGVIYAAILALIFSYDFSPRLGKGAAGKFFLLAWLLIFCCWIPCFIAFCPGLRAYDIRTQLLGIHYGTLTADHPLLHTLIAWGCLRLGRWIHSYTLGYMIFILSQMLALSASYAGVVAYLRRVGVPRFWQGGVLAWFALFPIHPLFAVNATKDVLFAACTIAFLLLVVELLRNPDRLRSVRFWVIYVAALLVMALMRNTGIYVFLIFIPLLVWLLPGRRLMALGLCLLCVAGFYGGRAALNAAIDVKDGRFTEALSVPLQQMARCAYDGVLTEEESEALEKYIPAWIWKNYNSRLADMVKTNINPAAIRRDVDGFVRLWIRLGARYPQEYMDAFWGMNMGYWYPDAEYPDPRVWHEYIETNSKYSPTIPIEDFDLWPEGKAFYQKVAKGAFESVPFVALFFKPGIYFWAILSLLALAIYRRKRIAGGVLAFLMVSWLFQLFSPIALLRYVYPMMTALPISLGCFYEKEEKSR